MTDEIDIVTRLRDDSDDPYFDLSKYPGTAVWLKSNWALREEAAAEILRLRSLSPCEGCAEMMNALMEIEATGWEIYLKAKNARASQPPHKKEPNETPKTQDA